jgi:hypothetical protein
MEVAIQLINTPVSFHLEKLDIRVHLGPDTPPGKGPT